MTTEPRDKHFGIPLSEWIERTPNELEVDAVGLWQIIPVGRDSFNLEGNALRNFVKRSVLALLARGAVPVSASTKKDKFWEKQSQYGESSEDIAESVVNEWEKSGKDPDEDGLWFALLADDKKTPETPGPTRCGKAPGSDPRN